MSVLITDPDLLNQSTEPSTGTPDGEVYINPSTRTIELIEFGNLGEAGVTLKALYSFLKEEWRDDDDLIRFDFPMTPITDESMQIGVSSRNNGWNWANTETRQLIRTGGWQEVDTNGVVQAEYAGIISLGLLEEGTQPYYQQDSTEPGVDFVFDGVVNEAVRVFENGGDDFRTFFKIFAREQGDTYSAADLGDIGVSTMTFQVYRFPLGTTGDVKIEVADTGIDANSDGDADVLPYSGMSIEFFDEPQSRTIGETPREFGIIIDGNSAEAEKIYEFVQWSLRQDGDINAGSSTINGRTADELLTFIGDTLRTLTATNPEGGGTGVFIDNFLETDVNRLEFTDNSGTVRIFPFTAVLTLNFSATLQQDTDAKFWVFFTNDEAGANAGNNFNTANAILVNNADGVPMTGDVNGASSISLSYAYDTNDQRGAGSPEQDAPVTAVALGLANAQYVLATGTIERSTANLIALVAPQERNYEE